MHFTCPSAAWVWEGVYDGGEEQETVVLVLETGEKFFHFPGGWLHQLLLLTETTAPGGSGIRNFIAANLHEEAILMSMSFNVHVIEN